MPGNNIKEGGAENSVPFWQLPLWIQVSFILAAIIAGLGVIKFTPVLLGKLKHLVENRRRDLIYTYIQSNPGSTVRDISRSEGINIGSVKYHVNQLGMAQRIVPKRIGKFLRLFQNSNTYTDKEKLVLSAFKNETSKSILIFLKNNPGAINRQIADNFDIRESTAHWYMDSLLRNRIITYVKEGKYKRYYIEEEVVPIIEKFTK
ncbi:MAG: winged helix-turn-helix transcriptional regulator [Methanocella sp.]